MKKLLLVLFSCVSIISFCGATPQEIDQFSSDHGLRTFSDAFLSVPECKYTIGSRKSKKSIEPSHVNRAVSPEAFEQTVDAFKCAFKGSANHSFFTQECWLGKPVDTTKHPHGPSDNTERYVQKLKVVPGSTICFLGDIHGSVHALMRILWRLVALGHLDENLKIKAPNFYIVFLGDFVDRGRWGAEVVTMLMALKLKNWDNVFPVAGNHETGHLATYYGFLNEMDAKFGHRGNALFNHVGDEFFKKLPVALFIECGDNAIQCCHGGIEPTYNPREFLMHKRALYQSVGPEHQCLGLFWNDFCGGVHDGSSTRGQGHVVVGKKRTCEYRESSGVKHIMRAHQDQEFGAKLFFADDFSPEAVAIKSKEHTYPHGPYYWVPVLQSLGITECVFPLARLSYYPVTTLTTACEPRAFPYDCFACVQTASIWDSWMLEIYEYFLGRDGDEVDREGKYVRLKIAADLADLPQTERVIPTGPQGKDPIGVSWHRYFDEDSVVN